MVTFWAPLLHIYQPPTQDLKILKEIDKECYKPLFNLLAEYENTKFGIIIKIPENKRDEYDTVMVVK